MVAETQLDQTVFTGRLRFFGIFGLMKLVTDCIREDGVLGQRSLHSSCFCRSESGCEDGDQEARQSLERCEDDEDG